MNGNPSNTRFLGFRLDPSNPRKITPQEVSEEVYFELGRPIWRYQKKMQGQGKCALSNVCQLWKCDGDCELCEYQRVGRCCQLDLEVTDENGDASQAIDRLAHDDMSPENITVDQMNMERLLERLAEICQDAIRIGHCMTENDLSTLKALKQLGINRSTYLYRLERAEKQLCKEFGVENIRELFE